MFGQFFAVGAVMPIFSLYLRESLGLSGAQIGAVLAGSSVAGVAAPLVASVVADRIVSAERLLSICHFTAAALMLCLRFQSGFVSVVLCYLAYTIALGPTGALINAVTFHHLGKGGGKEGKRFGNIRVFGTIGWIAVALGFGYLWIRGGGSVAEVAKLKDGLTLSALTSMFLGAYALTLPRREVVRVAGKVRLFPRDALRTLINPKVILLALAALVISIVNRYYYFGTAPFLKHLGFSSADILPLMSIGQVTEIFAMVGLFAFIDRLGMKTVLLLGVLMEAWRFAALSMASSTPLIISGIACHGLSYAFFTTTVIIAIDKECKESSRTGVHQLFTVLTAGVGSISANLLAGNCLDYFVLESQDGANYPMFWNVPLVLTGLTFVALAVAKIRK